MPLDRGHATDASLQTEARKKPVPPIEITEAYGPPVIWYDRLPVFLLSFIPSTSYSCLLYTSPSPRD